MNTFKKNQTEQSEETEWYWFRLLQADNNNKTVYLMDWAIYKSDF